MAYGLEGMEGVRGNEAFASVEKQNPQAHAA
jgi:hypothetical protein